MTQPPIRYDDGAAYERLMGAWSRLVGQDFLEFLSPSPGLRWLDVGCGNGAFTELVAQRSSPGKILGIDPSAGQIDFARTRLAGRNATFQQGDAMALPLEDASFDIAVMALVIHFVPQPARGVAEMARVVRPGGLVASYVWDQLGGGSPTEPFTLELQAVGASRPLLPSYGATRMAALRSLWEEAGLEEIETQVIAVQRTFANFDDLWVSSTETGPFHTAVSSMDRETIARFQAGLRARLPADAAGRITYAACANAIKGRVPAGG